MKLVYLGRELDVNVEHELFSEESNQFGFNVEVKYTEESWYPVKTQIFRNCTEVHHLFESLIEERRTSIAFESDIQGTGCNRKIENIESVVITIADKLYRSFC